MKTLPHNPPVEIFETLRPILDEQIAQGSETVDRAIAEEDGAALMKAGEDLIVRGMIGYLFDETPSRVADLIRRGLAHKRDAVEAGKFLNAWILWDYLLFSLAVNDVESADFFATMPQDRWWSREILPITWFVNRSRALVALYRGREQEAARHIENVSVQVFEEELPREVQDEKADIQNSVVLLRALQQKDSPLFQNSLEAREKWRGERYQGRGHAAPRALIDLDGLGLVRIAGDRGLKVSIRSPYLPLEMLKVK